MQRKSQIELLYCVNLSGKESSNYLSFWTCEKGSQFAFCKVSHEKKKKKQIRKVCCVIAIEHFACLFCIYFYNTIFCSKQKIVQNDFYIHTNKPM